MTGSSAVPVGVAPLEIECIQSAAGLEALRTVWSALADRAEGGAIYGGPAWLLPWARHHPWAHPYVLAARRGDRLTALLPLCVCEQGRGPVRWRALRFAADELADSCDAVWDPEWPGDLEALWEALLARKDWHLLDLRYVPSDSPLAGLARAASPRMRVLCEQTDAFLYLDLGPEWLQSLPKSQRSKLLRRRRQIGEEGDVSFTVAQTPGDVESMLGELYPLHIARWAGRGETSIFRFAHVRAWLQEACCELLARSELYLCRLSLNGDPVSLGMYVRQGRALVNHTYTFSEEYRRFGPVHLLVLFVIEDARARGLADVHSFGRGDEEYKHRWTSCSTTCERLLVARRTLAGRAIFRWESDVKPMVWRHPWLGGSLRELRRRWMLRRAAPPTQEADTDA